MNPNRRQYEQHSNRGRISASLARASKPVNRKPTKSRCIDRRVATTWRICICLV
ncbi:hypothetical protein QWZ13_02615 [Reinekea marina]|uniref:hypothetical protein n=1 Tax=Reinekea marina TaxID=1310421 RepID=UPI0025B4E301|nr:hypothetical protein [Reinekea marina]MDN3647802.1 hypothetical protein [Reinekea marina]